jgi:hypothetical protein
MNYMKRNMIIASVLFAALWTTQTALAWYDPSTGRWLSRDPLGEPGFQLIQPIRTAVLESASPSRWIIRDPSYTAEAAQGPNLYAFVRNSPATYWDRDGLELGYDYPSCGCMVPPGAPEDLGRAMQQAVDAWVIWGSALGLEEVAAAKLPGTWSKCKNIRCKVGYHPSPHPFPVIGGKPHIQITCWVKGVKGSDINIRIPLPKQSP